MKGFSSMKLLQDDDCLLSYQLLYPSFHIGGIGMGWCEGWTSLHYIQMRSASSYQSPLKSGDSYTVCIQVHMHMQHVGWEK